MKRRLYDRTDKSRGALLGLAIGDSLGAPYEHNYTSEQIRREIQNIDPSEINIRGPWTDDTSMALCLADSIIENNGYDSYDIMDRYIKWLTEGYRSSYSSGYGIGIQTAESIMAYAKNPESRNESQFVGNGCIMRLAPIVIANLENMPQNILQVAALSARETHDSDGAAAITELMAATLYLIFNNAPKENLLKNAQNLILNIKSVRFLESVKGMHRLISDKSGEHLRDLGGYAVDCYNIAMWGLMNFNNFADGMIAVIKLGGDTDTNAAVYGQLAGAYYSYNQIPKSWKDEVYLGKEIIDLSNQLVTMGKTPILKNRFKN